MGITCKSNVRPREPKLRTFFLLHLTIMKPSMANYFVPDTRQRDIQGAAQQLHYHPIFEGNWGKTAFEAAVQRDASWIEPSDRA